MTGPESDWRWIKAVFLVKPLFEFLKEIPDPRSERKKKHDHAEVLMLVIIGFLAGKPSLRRIVKWCGRKQELLKKHLKLEGGIPSLSTFSRIVSDVDGELLSLIFINWIGNILDTKGIHLVIDGKALRASTEKIKDRRAPYILNAIDAATNLVVGQIAIPEKTNEKTAIPRLLEILDITGSVVTIDAIGTTETIMKIIQDQGGYFVMQVKKNCPAVYQELTDIFSRLEEEKKEDGERFSKENKNNYDEYSTFEKNRERYEYRKMESYRNDEDIRKIRKDFTNVESIGLSYQVRIPKETDEEGNDVTPDFETFLQSGSRKCPRPAEGDQLTDEIQTVGMLSNKKMDAEKFLEYKRRHWRIENCLHYVLDNDFFEDRCTAKKGKNVLSVLRKFAYNVIRLIQIKEPEGRNQVIDVLDEIADNIERAEKYLFFPIPSFY